MRRGAAFITAAFIAAAFVAAPFIAAPSDAANKIKVTFDLAWGVKGNGPGRFNEPYDVAVGPGGKVYVTDTRNKRVQVFSKDGKFLSEFGKGVLEKPAGVEVDSDGNIFVTDYDLDRVFKFSRKGKVVMKFGRPGMEEGEFDSPSDVATDDDGNIYVADLYNHRVQKFDEKGKFITAWGKPSGAEDEENGKDKKKKKKSTKIFGFELPTEKAGAKVATFKYPAKLFVAGEKVYVADTYNGRVQVFSTSGEFQSVLPGRFNLASAIAAGPGNTVFVADYYGNRVRVYPNGEGGGGSAASEKFGKKGIGTGEFRGPTGIAASPDGYVYITDWLNHRVQRFRVEIDY